jgi:hypothetical protein
LGFRVQGWGFRVWGPGRGRLSFLGGRAGGEGSASWWSRFLVALERACRESAETLPCFHHHLEDFVLSAPIQRSTAAFARAASLSPLIRLAVYLRTWVIGWQGAAEKRGHDAGVEQGLRAGGTRDP